jgi:uncharacterized protein YggE
MITRQRAKEAGMLAVALVLIATSVYVAFGSAQAANTGTSEIDHTITVSGTGVVIVSPDEAKITLGAVTQGVTAQEASAANAKVINAVLAQLKPIGISDQNIATVTYNIWPTYDNSKSNSLQIVGYQAEHDLEVTVTNSNVTQLASLLGQVIDSATSAGANQISGVQFTVSDQTMSQLNGQALQFAIQDASSKAQVMANSLGVKIVGVQSVTEGSPYSPPIYYAAAVRDQSSTSVEPGTFSLTESVQVTYIIQ